MARIGLVQWCDDNDIELVRVESKKTPGKMVISVDNSPQLLEVLESATFDDSCPALCDEGCEVEPDGSCEHGAPSILIACGII